MTPHDTALAARERYLAARAVCLAEVYATVSDADARHAATMDALRAGCTRRQRLWWLGALTVMAALLPLYVMRDSAGAYATWLRRAARSARVLVNL